MEHLSEEKQRLLALLTAEYDESEIKHELDFAWAVGIFEGEGWITNSNDKRFGLLRLGIEMTDRDVLERFCAAVGVGTVSGPRQRDPKWRPLWLWSSATHDEATTLLKRMYPLLSQRRQGQAARAFATRAVVLERRMSERPCVGCGSSFVPDILRNAHNQLYCSKKCRRHNTYLRTGW